MSTFSYPDNNIIFARKKWFYKHLTYDLPVTHFTLENDSRY